MFFRGHRRGLSFTALLTSYVPSFADFNLHFLRFVILALYDGVGMCRFRTQRLGQEVSLAIELAASVAQEVLRVAKVLAAGSTLVLQFVQLDLRRERRVVIKKVQNLNASQFVPGET